MIYAVPSETYPKEGMFTEEIKYTDKNDFEWRIARVDSGFMVKYFGDLYFSNSTFECHLKSNRIERIKNSCCIFFQDASFETFYEVREVVKKGYTDDIWDLFEELFTERLNACPDVLEYERVE